MQLDDTYAQSIQGRVRIYAVGDVSRLLFEQDNLIVYQGADILARVLGYDVPAKVNGMYVEFQNNAGTPPVIVPARGDKYNTVFASGAYFAGDATADYLRQAVAAAPVFSSSGANYASNRVSFWSVTSDSPTGAVRSLAFGSGSNSKVRGAALTALPDSTPSNDLVFSRVSINPAVAVPAGMRIGIEWLLTFL